MTAPEKRYRFKSNTMQKYQEVLEMKIEGYSNEEIAKKFNWSQASVSAAVTRALRASPTATADMYREIHIARLEALWRGVLPQAKIGNPGAVRVAIQILRREAALLGLDAPVRVDVRRISDEYAREYGLNQQEAEALFIAIKGHLSDPSALPIGDEEPEPLIDVEGAEIET